MSKKSFLVFSFFLIIIPLWADDGQKAFLDKYLPPGLALSEQKIRPDYLSEKEIISVFAKPGKSLIGSDLKPLLEKSKIGKPIIIRILYKYWPYDTVDTRDFYRYFIPMFDPVFGLSYGAYSWAQITDREKKIRDIHISEAGGYGRPDTPTYLLTPEDARKLVENILHVKVKGAPFALRVGENRIVTINSWNWYMRSEEGVVLADGSVAKNFFVKPFAIVKDVKKVTLEELMTQESCRFFDMRRYRIYTIRDRPDYENPSKVRNIDNTDFETLSRLELERTLTDAEREMYNAAVTKFLVPIVVEGGKPRIVDIE